MADQRDFLAGEHRVPVGAAQSHHLVTLVTGAGPGRPSSRSLSASPPKDDSSPAHVRIGPVTWSTATLGSSTSARPGQGAAVADEADHGKMAQMGGRRGVNTFTHCRAPGMCAAPVPPRVREAARAACAPPSGRRGGAHAWPRPMGVRVGRLTTRERSGTEPPYRIAQTLRLTPSLWMSRSG